MLLQRIDELLRDQHSLLGSEDECYFLWEYYAHGGYQAGECNNLIMNLKKPMSRRQNAAEWRHKERCIRDAASKLRNVLPPQILNSTVVIPMPPSKTVGDPEYDDRMKQVADKLVVGSSARVVEAIRQRGNRVAQHTAGGYRTIDGIRANLVLDAASLEPAPRVIWLLDDVITSGASFVACSQLLSQDFGSSRIVGVFLARTVQLPIAEDEEVDSDDW